MRLRILALAPLLLLAACGESRVPTGLLIGFEPAASAGGGFGVGVTEFAGDDACAVPDEIATIVVDTYSPDLTQTPSETYSVGDLGDDCQLTVLLPENAQMEVEISAFTGDGELVRKNFGEFVVEPGDAQQVEPIVLWPATRIADDGEGDGTPDLLHVDVLRQFDRFVFDMVFAGPLAPATQGGDDAVAGFLELAHGGDNFYVLLDATGAGMTFYAEEEPSEVSRVPFEFAFATRSLKIALPYDLVGGRAVDPNSGDAIDAPAMQLSAMLLNADDSLNDAVPDSGSAATE